MRKIERVRKIERERIESEKKETERERKIERENTE